MEAGGERRQAVISHRRADIRDGGVGLCEEALGALDPSTRDVTVRRLAECGRKGAMEVMRREARFAGRCIQVEDFRQAIFEDFPTA